MADSDFCPHCGTLTGLAEQIGCGRHPDRQAAAVCIMCGMPVCDSCAVKKHGKWFCKDHASVHVEQDWALVLESPDINKAELARSVLEAGGFHVIVRNFGPNTAVWEGGGDSLFSRQQLNRLAKVFVPLPEYLNAVQSLLEWEEAGDHH
ncbi:MAG: hypothetical protein HBSIN02_02080 [Bacteroidia bacterium]|nr:MAG: hypothetical protein HBSIN02_02080 [Bacteroidia bacterium]